MTKHEIVEELLQIRDDIKSKISRAQTLIKETGDYSHLHQAKSYWIAHILGALDDDHDWLSGSFVTMYDSITEIAGDETEEEEEEL